MYYSIHDFCFPSLYDMGAWLAKPCRQAYIGRIRCLTWIVTTFYVPICSFDRLANLICGTERLPKPSLAFRIYRRPGTIPCAPRARRKLEERIGELGGFVELAKECAEKSLSADEVREQYPEYFGECDAHEVLRWRK